jgi:hypothetical protein
MKIFSVRGMLFLFSFLTWLELLASGNCPIKLYAGTYNMSTPDNHAHLQVEQEVSPISITQNGNTVFKQSSKNYQKESRHLRVSHCSLLLAHLPNLPVSLAKPMRSPR